MLQFYFHNFSCNKKTEIFSSRKVILLSFVIIFIATMGIDDVYGLKKVVKNVELKLSPGESQTFEFGLVSDRDAPYSVEMSSDGEGSEFLSFPDSVVLEPKVLNNVKITVSIPQDHPNDVFYKPTVYATDRGEKTGQTIINIRMKQPVSIIIGNPVIPEGTAPQTQVAPEPATTPDCEPGTILKGGKCVPEKQATQPGGIMLSSKESSEEPKEGGGCLIATAAYGTELAPQVQLLREIRDNTVQSTESGSSFMSTFNEFYYSFSPTIADLERENPIFKETVKLFITPMLSSLSIMTLAEPGSEIQVIGFGISVIALNVGLYVALPTIAIVKISKRK